MSGSTGFYAMGFGGTAALVVGHLQDIYTPSDSILYRFSLRHGFRQRFASGMYQVFPSVKSALLTLRRWP